MNQLSLPEAQRFVLNEARQRGASVEVYASRSSSTSVKAFQGAVSEFKLSQRGGLGVRALVSGAWGYSFTENLSPEALTRCLEDALENAGLVAPEGHASLAAHAEPPHVGDLYGEGLSGVTVDRKVGAAIALERAAMTADPRVKSVPYSAYQDGESEITVANTEGLDRGYKSNYVTQYAMPLVSEGGQNKSHFDFQFSREFEQLDPTRTALESVQKSLALLGARMPASGALPAVVENRCMAQLLETFDHIFNAKMVQEGKSPLRDKLTQRVAAEGVTLRDDATRAGGRASRPFDAEGFPSQPITLLENGVLKHFLHNTETAAKDGIESTGHASRFGYRGTVGIAPSNFYLEPGSATPAELMAGIERGVMVIGVQGTHAGANPVTGEFSLQADGFWIQDGQIAYPLENFTVAGNILELLCDIELIGNDLEFDMGGTGAPSVRVSRLNIGGV
jgi:PmbA protein